MWQAGNIVCVVGKTPKEEGDNKVFVENAHFLTLENAHSIAQHPSLGKSPSVRGGVASEKKIILTMSKETLQQATEALRACFVAHPGENQVYFRVGPNLIRTKQAIAWDDEVKKTLGSLVGESAIATEG